MLGEEIRFARQKAFVSQEEFAKRLHVALSTVNRWEVGKARPSLTAMKNMKDFCTSHGISFDAIESAWLHYGMEDCQDD